MSDAIIATIITGGVSLGGIIMTAVLNQRKITKEFEKQNIEFQHRSELADVALKAELERYTAVTDEKISELTREVRSHNEFGRRIPVMEEQIKQLERLKN